MDPFAGFWEFSELGRRALFVHTPGGSTAAKPCPSRRAPIPSPSATTWKASHPAHPDRRRRPHPTPPLRRCRGARPGERPRGAPRRRGRVTNSAPAPPMRCLRGLSTPTARSPPAAPSRRSSLPHIVVYGAFGRAIDRRCVCEHAVYPSPSPVDEVAMPELALEFEFFAQLASADFGAGPFGQRVLFRGTGGGTVKGGRLNGVMEGPGGDWFLSGADGYGRIDVRSNIRTVDDALIYVQYHGLVRLTPAVLTMLN